SKEQRWSARLRASPLRPRLPPESRPARFGRGVDLRQEAGGEERLLCLLTGRTLAGLGRKQKSRKCWRAVRFCGGRRGAENRNPGGGLLVCAGLERDRLSGLLHRRRSRWNHGRDPAAGRQAEAVGQSSAELHLGRRRSVPGLSLALRQAVVLGRPDAPPLCGRRRLQGAPGRLRLRIFAEEPVPVLPEQLHSRGTRLRSVPGGSREPENRSKENSGG